LRWAESESFQNPALRLYLNVTTHMKKTLIILILIHCTVGFSQSESNCEEILSKEIILNPANAENLNNIVQNVSLLKNCGLDDRDIELVTDDQVLATILIVLAVEEQTESNLTYQRIYDKILEIKQWGNSKESHKNGQKEAKTIEDDYDGIFKNAGNVDYEDLLKKSIELDKPLLLYFTGYASVNGRKIEMNILSESSIKNRLENEFYFVNLYVDDKNWLPENEDNLSIINGMPLKYVGQKHMELQISKFKNNQQPYFVIIDKNGNKIRDIGYTTDTDEFEDFLYIEE